MVRYADQSTNQSSDDGVSRVVYNAGDIPSNWTSFDEIWANSISSTIEKASNNFNRIGINEVVLPWDQRTLYALMQCAPYLQPSTCFECLRARADKYLACCHGKQGGVSSSPVCVFRWELYPFYNISLSPSLPPQ